LILRLSAVLGLSLVPFSFSSPSWAHAQSPARALVQVTCACGDEIGKTYSRLVHERLASSRSMREVSGSEASSADVIHVRIATHPLPPLHQGDFGRTAIEIVGMHNGDTIHQTIETCNELPVDVCVSTMLAAISEM
jgi:hypothetical protein